MLCTHSSCQVYLYPIFSKMYDSGRNRALAVSWLLIVRSTLMTVVRVLRGSDIMWGSLERGILDPEEAGANERPEY